jgi:hypothetical protein
MPTLAPADWGEGHRAEISCGRRSRLLLVGSEQIFDLAHHIGFGTRRLVRAGDHHCEIASLEIHLDALGLLALSLQSADSAPDFAHFGLQGTFGHGVPLVE